MKWQPRASSARARATLCARSQPPSTQSVAEMRTPTATDDGTAARTASNTRNTSRIRFSRLPPYASSRALLSGDRNWCSR